MGVGVSRLYERSECMVCRRCSPPSVRMDMMVLIGLLLLLKMWLLLVSERKEGLIEDFLFFLFLVFRCFCVSCQRSHTIWLLSVFSPQFYTFWLFSACDQSVFTSHSMGKGLSTKPVTRSSNTLKVYLTRLTPFRRTPCGAVKQQD